MLIIACKEYNGLSILESVPKGLIKTLLLQEYLGVATIIYFLPIGVVIGGGGGE